MIGVLDEAEEWFYYLTLSGKVDVILGVETHDRYL